MNDDATLLRQYAEKRSELAFSELVQRHVNLVYSAALRRTNQDPHYAADVAQQVFTNLAANASKLSRHSALSAWLYATTRNAAINLMLSEQRRKHREQEAHAMHELSSGSSDNADWDQLRPVLDTVMDELSETDRIAVILRFFQNRPFTEIGAELGLTENTARMRTERALEKLRALLARRGVTSPTAALAMTLSAQAAIAPPPGFAASVASTALASAADGSAKAAVLHSFLSMNKITVGVVSGVVVAALVTAIVEMRANRALNAEINSSIPLIQEPAATSANASKGIPEADELVRLRNRIAQLKARPAGVVESEMKPRTEWRNVGRATPAAALETLLWAYSSRDMDTLADSHGFVKSDREILNSWFAGLSETMRAKYGTPERLLAPLDGGLSQFSANPVVAFQVMSQQYDHGTDAVNMTYWVRLASGQEQQAVIRAQSDAGSWKIYPTSKGMSESQWQTMVFSQINPATGEPATRSP